MVVHSATLALNEQMTARHAAGREGLHLGFGEAGLPVPADVARVLSDASGRNSYAPVAGTDDALAATAGYLSRRGIPTATEQVILTPGSKAGLYGLIACLPGDLVLPAPSWVSYAPQAELAGKKCIGVPIPSESGGVPDPGALASALGSARNDGLEPGIIILTVPDNPTGTVAGKTLLKQVIAVAEEFDLAIVSDEIYRDLAHDGREVVSPSVMAPDRTFVTTGLSKCMALGGYRIGAVRFPATEAGARTRDEVIGLASEIWSSLAGPMQDVATYVFGEEGGVREHVAASARLHARVAAAVYAAVVAGGARCRPPEGGFYIYPDLADLRPGLTRQGITTGADLTGYLLEEHGLGVLPGVAFGDDPTALRFRAATSLLYGETAEQRWEALAADDPTALPWIADAVDRVGAVFRALPRD